MAASVLRLAPAALRAAPAAVLTAPDRASGRPLRLPDAPLPRANVRRADGRPGFGMLFTAPAVGAAMLGMVWAQDAGAASRNVATSTSEIALPADALSGHTRSGQRRIAHWRAFLSDLKANPPNAQRGLLEKVHDYAGRKIRSKQERRGADDWKGAVRALGSGSGDCEDYALTKYASLRMLGVPADDLTIAVVAPRNSRQWHAVLLVKADDGGAPWVLDNLKPNVRRFDSRGAPMLFGVNELSPGHPKSRKAFAEMQSLYGGSVGSRPFISPRDLNLDTR